MLGEVHKSQDTLGISLSALLGLKNKTKRNFAQLEIIKWLFIKHTHHHLGSRASCVYPPGARAS